MDVVFVFVFELANDSSYHYAVKVLDGTDGIVNFTAKSSVVVVHNIVDEGGIV